MDGQISKLIRLLITLRYLRLFLNIHERIEHFPFFNYTTFDAIFQVFLSLDEIYYEVNKRIHLDK